MGKGGAMSKQPDTFDLAAEMEAINRRIAERKGEQETQQPDPQKLHPPVGAAPAGRPVATPQMGTGETPVPSPDKKKLRVDHEDKSSDAVVPMVVKTEPSPTLPDPPTEVGLTQPEHSPTAPTIAADLGSGDGTAAMAEPSVPREQVGGANNENLEGQGKESDEPMSMEPQNLDVQFAEAVDVTGKQTPPASPGAVAAVMVSPPRFEFALDDAGSFDMSKAPTLQLGDVSFDDWYDHMLESLNAKNQTRPPMTLSTCLKPLFDGGITPGESCGKLQEETLAWGHFVATNPSTKKECLGDMVEGSQLLAEVEELISKHEVIISRMESIAVCKRHGVGKLEAVIRAALTSYQKMVDMVKNDTNKDAEQKLRSRKETVEKWVASHRKSLQDEVNAEIKLYQEKKCLLSSSIDHVLTLMYDMYKDSFGPAVDMKHLEAELEAELEKTLGNSPVDTSEVESQPSMVEVPSTPDERVLQTPTTVKSTEPADSGTKTTKAVPVTDAFEAIQAYVSETLAKSGASIDLETQKKLHEKLGSCFKDIWEKPTESAESTEASPLPPHAPELEGREKAMGDLARASQDVLVRKDTSQNEEELYAKHPDGVKMADGTWRLKHTDQRGNAKYETFEERENREAHNSYMRFSRTFDSVRTPASVIKAGEGRKHNRVLLQKLFEDWLSSGEDWGKSSTHLNYIAKTGTRKRGKHVYVTFKTLKERFGLSAKVIRDKKYELEAKRAAGDTSEAWWTKHPELPDDKEQELFRIWDSCELEYFEENTHEYGFRHESVNSEAQTGILMKSLLAKEPASSSLMLANPAQQPGGGSGNALPGPDSAEPKKKPKKEVSLNRKAASTVSGLSSKVTDLRCLVTQLENSELSGSMKNAYIEEVEGCKLDLENAKISLETWYAKRYPEAEIVGAVKEEYERHMGTAEKVLQQYNGKSKQIRSAMAPPKAKAKGKAKAAPAPAEAGKD